MAKEQRGLASKSDEQQRIVGGKGDHTSAEKNLASGHLKKRGTPASYERAP
jgi:hypothetical protein